MAHYLVEAWKKPKINYRLIEATGKPKILYATNQGFERKAGMINNLQSVKDFFCRPRLKIDVTIYWKKTAKSRKTISEERIQLP